MSARSLNGNALCKVSRLIYIAPFEDCCVVSKQLKWYHGYEGGEQMVDRRNLYNIIHVL